MNTIDFLSQLRTLDIQVSADNGKLRVNAPKGAVTPEIQTELSSRKVEILSLLAQTESLFPEQRADVHLLSAAQAHLWQLHRLMPDTAPYHMYAVFRLRGALNVQALEAAIEAVVERHPSLRAFFPQTTGGAPELSVAPASCVPLRRVTLSESDSSQDEAIQALIDAELKAPFDLSTGPLFRPTLVQIHPDEHVLILVMHHMIFDGHSFGVFYKDLEHAYHAACEGRPAGLPPLPVQYADYAAWQHNWLDSDASAADRTFWQDQLSGEVPALALPFDHPHPPYPTTEGDSFSFRLDPQVSQALRDLCRREGVTLFSTALVAFNLLLHRSSGQTDLVICTPVAARDRMEFSDIVGYFNNTLLLRTDLTKASTIRELLQQTHALVVEALSRQMFPFKEVAGFPNMARTPLSRAMLAVQSAPDNPLHLNGLEIQMMPDFNGAVQYDLAIEFKDSPHQLSGRIIYRKALFEHETITRLARELTGIFEEMLADIDSTFSLVGAEQSVIQITQQESPKLPTAPPRSELERRLVQIWQELLGIEPIGIYDEFFALGGHSLLALRLFTRIEEETGAGLPLSILFEKTTISRLARLIEGDNASRSWDCLVPIQPNGSNPPFFCVHGVGGGVLGYRDLQTALGDDQPFIGLQAIGRDGLNSYDLTIEAMASRYIEEMCAYQPEGSYRIGGYCFGGVVAYEMARQLQQMGKEVSLVAIMEGSMPEAIGYRFSPLRRLGIFLRSIPVWIKDYASLPPDKIMYRIRTTLTHLWARVQRNPTIRRRARVEETLDIDISGVPRRHIELTEVHMKAAMNYVPEAYEGAVTLFRARNRGINEVLFGSLDPTMGWSSLAKGGVDVRLVDGFHRNMHLNQYARTLAAEMKKCLNTEFLGIDHASDQDNK